MITVHVGLHKTGSTSIQAALGLVRHRLALLVLPPNVEGLWTRPERIAKIVAASKTGAVVISDEGIMGGMADAYGSAGERLDSLRTALSDTPFEIVLYLRPQLDWLASAYLQLVQEGGTVSSRDFWESVRDQDLLSWSVLCNVVAQRSGAERVRVRAHVPGRDVVEDFFAVCGIGAAPRPTSAGIRINESISAIQAPILARLNRDESISPDGRLRLRHMFQGPLAVGVDRDWSPFPQDVQVQIADRYRADWLDVADVLEVADPEEAQVFRDASALWDRPVQRFPGEFGEPTISAELLRSLAVLAQRPEDRSLGIWGRAMAKAKDSPGDLPRAVRAALHRRPAD